MRDGQIVRLTAIDSALFPAPLYLPPYRHCPILRTTIACLRSPIVVSSSGLAGHMGVLPSTAACSNALLGATVRADNDGQILGNYWTSTSLSLRLQSAPIHREMSRCDCWKMDYDQESDRRSDPSVDFASKK